MLAQLTWDQHVDHVPQQTLGPWRKGKATFWSRTDPPRFLHRFGSVPPGWPIAHASAELFASQKREREGLDEVISETGKKHGWSVHCCHG